MGQDIIRTSQYWVCPQGVYEISVSLVGGQGGGSSVKRVVYQNPPSTFDQDGWEGGDGGSGGGNYSVNPSESYYITVGEGGFGGFFEGTGCVSGEDGEDSTAFIYTANGGKGGSEGVIGLTGDGVPLVGGGGQGGSGPYEGPAEDKNGKTGNPGVVVINYDDNSSSSS